ncbi:MAG: fatty acid desaturase [Armatimonadetes bacterium]|nr:fatty acid desaturase [Armatimonadota bacterium]
MMATGPRPSTPGSLSVYARPNVWRSLGQMGTSFGPFVVLWALAWWLLRLHPLAALPVSLAAGLFLVRIFIIQHDCGHGSFFRSKRACSWVGRLCSLFTATPYGHWRSSHAQHHAQVGKLEGRGVGDINTMTLREWREAGWRKRLLYRLYRHPLVLFGIGPVSLFLIGNRFCSADDRPSAKLSVNMTNLALAATVTIACLLFGWREFLLVQLPATFLACSVGVWLFYVQHQFEDTYWAHATEWDLTEAAIRGSSYYRLPALLQWLTGNIGLHHVHHLNSRIPNYNLQRCHDDVPVLHEAPVLTLASSLRCVRLALWDEDARRLVSFGEGHRR